jgi:hypothetical protein
VAASGNVPWPENLAITTPQERYPESGVRVSKANTHVVVLLFAYHQLIPVTPVRIIVRIAIIAAVSIKASTKTKATASQTIMSDSAAIYRDPVATETAVAHRVTSAAKTAMASAMAASAVASTASCERGCAGCRCRYAERDDRSRCNYLFAHFSKLLMFDLICGTV